MKENRMKDKIKEITATITAIGVLVTTISKQKYLKGLFGFLGEYKEYSIIIVILLLSLLIIYFLYRILRNNIDLEKHNFFSQMDFYIDYNIETLRSEVTEQKLVFVDLLVLKFDFWKATCKMLVEEFHKGNIKDQCYFKKWFTDSIREQDLIMRHNNIPPEVIKIFNRWHKKRVAITLRFIQKIIQSNKNNKYIINALLTYLDNVFDETIIDVETAIYTLNGDLKGITYHRIINNNNEKILL